MHWTVPVLFRPPWASDTVNICGHFDASFSSVPAVIFLQMVYQENLHGKNRHCHYSRWKMTKISLQNVVEWQLGWFWNILEESNRRAWWDLSAQTRLKVATNLLLALEDNAFLLAGVVNEPSEILETHEIMSKYIGSNYMSLYILVSPFVVF